MAPPARPAMTQVGCNVPTITPLGETKEAQEKGGVEITIVPDAYESALKERVVTRQTDPPALELLVNSSQDKRVYVVQTRTPYLEVEPRRIKFTVRVNNKLSRVFRGQGSVVQFNIDGKLVPFDNIDYKEFLNGIVPPRNETEFAVYGPPIDTLPQKGTIGIFLYDVVTATDVAGNVTEKQNYEWYFNCEMKRVEQAGEASVKRGYLDPEAYSQEMAREREARGN